MRFHFVATDISNHIRRGLIEAEEGTQAEANLLRQGYRIHVLREHKPGLFSRATLQRLSRAAYEIKAKDIIAFTRSLATLLGSGMTIMHALSMLREQTGNPLMREILDQLRREVASGQSLAAALAKHPRHFSSVYVHMIAAAEETGAVDRVLEELSGYMEKQSANKHRFIQALMYPAITLLVTAGVMLMLFTVVLPQLVSLFSAFNADLPLATRMLIQMADFVADQKYILLSGLLAAAAIIYFAMQTSAGIRAFHTAILRIPVIGQLFLKADLSRFLTSLGRLIKGGAALPESINLASQTVTNVRLREALEAARQELIKGRGFAAPMREHHRIIPPMVAQVAQMGEETGTLEQGVTRLGQHYEREVDDNLRSLTTVLDPAITLVVGLGITFIAISIIMPIYSIISEVGNAASV